MKTNTKLPDVYTHEGGAASRILPFEELRRAVLSCMLFEDSFYESGNSVADRIKKLILICDSRDVAALAIVARDKYKLRHVPLFMVRELARKPQLPDGLVASTLYQVVRRADELTEFLAIYWKDGRQPLSAQVKKGLAKAFGKFDEYQLAKWDNKKSAVRIADVMSLVRPKPADDAQAALWKRVKDGTLAAPDTWERRLSTGEDKRVVFESLLRDGKLGYMALLRNLRNMYEADVDKALVFAALQNGALKSKALPFRFVAAARAVPAWEREIDAAMMVSMMAMDRMAGTTAVVVDVSGSMDKALSSRSDLSRGDAANALAVLVSGICENPIVFSFSGELKRIPPRSGMALVDAINSSQGHGITMLGKSVSQLLESTSDLDRIIVITDEQARDKIPSIGNSTKGYIINVATYSNGVGYNNGWTHINGFSEAVIDFISECEKLDIKREV